MFPASDSDSVLHTVKLYLHRSCTCVAVPFVVCVSSTSLKPINRFEQYLLKLLCILYEMNVY